MRNFIFFTVLTSLLFSNSLFAQRNRERDADYFPRNEIYIQYGTPTVLELVTTLKAPTQFGSADTKNNIFTGVAGLGYNFFISNRFMIGIYGGASYAKADICLMNDDETISQRLYAKGVMSYVGQLSASWIFYNEGSIQLSSGVYLGMAYWDEDITVYDNKSSINYPHASDQFKFSYHLTACKFRWGDTFGVFAELGFGFRGLVNAGLSVQL